MQYTIIYNLIQCVKCSLLNKSSATLGLFDTILADYLIGAVDGFSPYTQDIIVEKLSHYLKPGGKIYVIGMNPSPDTNLAPTSVVSEVSECFTC